MTNSKITQGSTIGIIGGGQLGRMSAVAAKYLGYKTHIFSPDEGSPAKQVSDYSTTAEYDDRAALEKFASSVDVVSFEFENIPFETLNFITEHTLVRPNPKSLHVSQNRVREKNFLNSIGVKTAPYKRVTNQQELREAFQTLGIEKGILKTSEMGYDGKGQQVVSDVDQVEDFNGAELVLEGFIDFSCEISVIVARGLDGDMRCFPVGENIHKDGILDTTEVPASISENVADSAQRVAEKIAQSLEFVGLLAVEFFVGKNDEIIVNEIAPRPHNSGHWTMDGCVTSQFEQFVRAICGLDLGAVDLIGNKTKMQNLIGDEINAWQHRSDNDNGKLHVYGKKEARPGRKMGHVNFVTDVES